MKKFAVLFTTIGAIGGLGSGASAQQSVEHKANQPYAGQQTRQVSSLSDEEVKNFLSGRGMGLAKSAELNGFPGPAHVLELESALSLSVEQKTKVVNAFNAMQSNAVDLGVRYVAAETAVDSAFQAGSAPTEIAVAVAEANRLLGEIRMSHLKAHLEITPLLTPAQRAKYANLRGYAGQSGDPNATPQHKH